MSGRNWRDGERPVGKPLSAMFVSTGPGFAACKICGARVKRNALAYSGHMRGKQHQKAEAALAAMQTPKPAKVVAPRPTAAERGFCPGCNGLGKIEHPDDADGNAAVEVCAMCEGTGIARPA